MERWSDGGMERWSDGGTVLRYASDLEVCRKALRQSSWGRQVIGGQRIEEVKLILGKGDRHPLI